MKISVRWANNLFEWFFVAVVLLTSYTIYFRLPVMPIFNFSLLVVVLLLFSSKKQDKLVMAFIFGIVFLRASLSSFDSNIQFISQVSLLINALLISSFFLIRDYNLISIFTRLTKLLSIIVAFGVLIHLIMLSGVVNFTPVKQVLTEDRIYNIYYWGAIYESRIEFRFASIFNEPGYLGTILALILAINRYNLKKPANIVFFIAGILTLSLAFYMLSIVYYLYLIRSKLGQAFFVGLVLILTIILVGQIAPDLFDKYVYNRLHLDGVIFYGEVRGIEASKASYHFLFSQEPIYLLFGNGQDAHQNINLAFISNSAWGRLVYQIGVLFFLYFIIILFYYGRRNWQSLIFVIIFIVSIYQRPQIFQSLIIFLLAVGLSQENNVFSIEKHYSKNEKYFTGN